jgi:hypothetical protein
MKGPDDHEPGQPAPATGTYEQLNIMGTPTGIRAQVSQGHPLPRAPFCHTWRLVDTGTAGCC